MEEDGRRQDKKPCRGLAVEDLADILNRLRIQHEPDGVARVDRDTHAYSLLERLQTRHADRVRRHVNKLLGNTGRVSEHREHGLLVGALQQQRLNFLLLIRNLFLGEEEQVRGGDLGEHLVASQLALRTLENHTLNVIERLKLARIQNTLTVFRFSSFRLVSVLITLELLGLLGRLSILELLRRLLILSKPSVLSKSSILNRLNIFNLRGRFSWHGLFRLRGFLSVLGFFLLHWLFSRGHLIQLFRLFYLLRLLVLV